MKLLITGINGFAGRHLAHLALELGWSVMGTVRSSDTGFLDLDPTKRVRVASWNLTTDSFPAESVRPFGPDAIAHLAAESFAGSGGLGSDGIWQSNLMGTKKLLEAVAAHFASARILYVGTGLAYGPPASEGTKSDELQPLCPPNNYAATKACADLLAFQASRDPGLAVMRARPFNHIGPGQSARFAVASFARQFAMMKRGLAPHRLETGNLASRRDLTDVRDIVRGYADILLQGKPGEAYNLGSGNSLSMQTVVDFFAKATGIQPQMATRAELLRKSDPPALLADNSKAHRDLGWAPRIPLEQTLTDILEDWLARPQRDLLPS